MLFKCILKLDCAYGRKTIVNVRLELDFLLQHESWMHYVSIHHPLRAILAISKHCSWTYIHIPVLVRQWTVLMQDQEQGIQIYLMEKSLVNEDTVSKFLNHKVKAVMQTKPQT